MVPPLTLCAYMKKGPNLRWSLIQCSGGDEGDRTPDLLTASQALSQLSYAPVRRSTIRELGRRCKDNFGKLSAAGARMRDGLEIEGPSMPDPARGRRPRRLPPFRRPQDISSSAVFRFSSAGRHSSNGNPAGARSIIGADRAFAQSAISKPCRITGLERGPPSMQKLVEIKPQVDDSHIPRNAVYGRPVRVQPRNPT